MKQFIIELTAAEEKALAAVAVSPLEWITNFTKERCRLAIEDIVSKEVQRKLALGESISGTKEDIVLAAPIESAADQHARIQAEILARAQIQEQA